MAQLSLNNVIQVIQTYLRDCLKEDAIKIKIQTEDFQFSGISAKRAHFMLSDIPGLKIRGLDFASKIQFHGYLTGRSWGHNGDSTEIEEAAVIVLDDSQNELKSITGSTQQRLLNNLRQKLIFITPQSAPGQPTADDESISIVQQLRELNVKVDVILALLQAHH